MPKFSYVAMDSRGKETKGTLEVSSQNEAIGRVKEMGLFPTKIVEVDRAKEAGDKKAKPAGGKPAAKGKKGQININIKIPGLGGRGRLGLLDPGDLSPQGSQFPEEVGLGAAFVVLHGPCPCRCALPSRPG